MTEINKYRMVNELNGSWGIIERLSGKYVLTGESYQVASNIEYALNTKNFIGPSETDEVAKNILSKMKEREEVKT